MKKIFLLSIVVVFALIGPLAFASPPIAPPVEGFIIKTTTNIQVQGDMQENQAFNWTYYEGWGKGPFYPNMADGSPYVPAGACAGSWLNDCCESANCDGIVSELGFTEGAEIAYQQDFKAFEGSTTFVKTFEAYSHPDNAAGQNNLKVHKTIDFIADDPDVGYAEHTEKVGLSIISMGAANSAAGSPAAGLLSLCPWAAENPGTSGGGYPPTNEGIAAASHFKVSNIQGFVSDSVVNSTTTPSLKYDVTAIQGTGFIEAGFVVELWEGPKGYVWAPIPIYDWELNDEGIPVPTGVNTCCLGLQCWCDQRAIIQNGVNPWAVWQLPQYAYGEPPLASRTSYSEYASADGTWAFTKNVLYQSVMPGGASSSTFPFERVLP